MPRRGSRARNNAPRNSRNSRFVASADTRLLNTMQNIEVMQSLQIRGTQPRVPDVREITLKRNKVHTFADMFQATQLTSSTTVDQSIAYAVALSSFNDAGSYAAVFDQYRIVQLTIEFIPRGTNVNASPLYSVIDYDDNTSLASLNALNSYDSVMVTQAGQIHTRTLNPRIAVSAYSTTFNSFANLTANTWIDAASPNVTYYGLKVYLPTGATVEVYDVNVRGILQFRSQR